MHACTWVRRKTPVVIKKNVDWSSIIVVLLSFPVPRLPLPAQIHGRGPRLCQVASRQVRWSGVLHGKIHEPRCWTYLFLLQGWCSGSNFCLCQVCLQDCQGMWNKSLLDVFLPTLFPSAEDWSHSTFFLLSTLCLYTNSSKRLVILIDAISHHPSSIYIYKKRQKSKHTIGNNNKHVVGAEVEGETETALILLEHNKPYGTFITAGNF